jgi:hypothetical protein
MTRCSSPPRRRASTGATHQSSAPRRASSNGFIPFYTQHFDTLRSECEALEGGKVSVPRISALAAKKYRELTPDEKQQYMPKQDEICFFSTPPPIRPPTRPPPTPSQTTEENTNTESAETTEATKEPASAESAESAESAKSTESAKSAESAAPPANPKSKPPQKTK